MKPLSFSKSNFSGQKQVNMPSLQVSFINIVDMKNTIVILLAFLFAVITNSGFSQKKQKVVQPPSILKTLQDTSGVDIVIEFYKGKSFNYPLMAVWVEDTDGNYIETIYIAESIAKGVFNYGQASKGKWAPGPKRRPAALPYWSHRRNMLAEDGLYIPTSSSPIPDAFTGETPTNNFILYSKAPVGKISRFNVYFEINQTWDFNEYWTNNKFPDNEEYKTSCQPALVYKTTIDLGSNVAEYEMKAIGHSHYAGETGELFSDLSTLTTALNIADKILVKIVKNKE